MAGAKPAGDSVGGPSPRVWAMRTSTTPISVTTGCNASTARGTLASPRPITTAADTTPANAQAIVNRCTSPKPEKRHRLCGTLNSTKAAR